MARSDREGSLGCVRASYRQAMEKVNAVAEKPAWAAACRCGPQKSVGMRGEI
tara:strand:+ start:665 stop:820 length:156 start_codon:yes stop_codon:yes gene_type:complete